MDINQFLLSLLSALSTLEFAMTNGDRIITIPRANPVDAFTMAGIVRDAGLSIDEFKNLL